MFGGGRMDEVIEENRVPLGERPYWVKIHQVISDPQQRSALETLNTALDRLRRSGRRY